MTSGIPLLDLSDLRDQDKKHQFLKSLIASFQRFGFVRFTGHGIPVESIKHTFSLAEKVFQLSPEEKTQFRDVPDGTPQRGYSAIGTEKTAALFGNLHGNKAKNDLTDAREHFDCGSPYDADFPGRWPQHLPGFRPAIEDFYLQMETCKNNILFALEQGLAVESGTLTKNFTSQGGASELRLNHYPSIKAGALRSGKVSRIWPHYDLGVLTLLFTSDVGGLEVWDRHAPGPEKHFIPVQPETETEMIVNISETLQRWTNDQLPAGLHRVQMPQELEGSGDDARVPSRYSVAFFCKADREASAGVLPPFRAGGDVKYNDMTALEYHQSRLLSAY